MHSLFLNFTYLHEGYFSLMIQDCDGVKQWFKDNSSVGHKLLDSGERVQTGRLNFSNGLYESKWKFRPNPPLYAGYAKGCRRHIRRYKLNTIIFAGKRHTSNLETGSPSL